MTPHAPTLPHPSRPRDGGHAGSHDHRDEHAYVLGTGNEESVRLGLQHRLWSAAAHQLWEKARIQPGMAVMDLGCGPGYAAMDLAEIVGPAGRVLAVDESASFLKHVHDLSVATRMHNIERVLGDVQELGTIIEDGAGTIDAAYARWVFCFLKNPEAVVTGLKPLLKAGGRLVIQDYFSYEFGMTMAPRSPIFSKVVEAVGKSWRDAGGDPDVMGRLPGMLIKHGFRIRHMDVVQRIARPGSQLWHWPDSFWKSFVPRLVASGHISASEQQEFFAIWTAASQDPACFVQLPPVYELIAVCDERGGSR
jgi:ubiquinone/menaquinone biosynthesis C-methylase UbiE